MTLIGFVPFYDREHAAYELGSDHVEHTHWML